MIMLQYIFSQVLVLISEHLSYFKVLHISKRFYFPRAFIFRVLLPFKRFYFYFLFVSQRLFFILLSMKQCPIFVSKQFLDHISLLFFGLFLNMFQMLVLIMYKTSRF
jgi:hypothetical protein